MKFRIYIALAAGALTLAGCTVNGGATLTPLISEGAGTAVFAVSANIREVVGGLDIRTAGTYRNSTGISFAFKANETNVTPEPLVVRTRQVAPLIHDARCGFFAGTFSNARGLGSKTGLVYGAVLSGSDLVDESPATIVELVAFSEGESEPHFYVGRVKSGSFKMPSTQPCFELEP